MRRFCPPLMEPIFELAPNLVLIFQPFIIISPGKLSIFNKLIRANLVIFLCSFPTDFQLVADATVILSTQAPGSNNVVPETLTPARHQISLPLNGLNILFDNCTTAFNFHNKLDTDR